MLKFDFFELAHEGSLEFPLIPQGLKVNSISKDRFTINSGDVEMFSAMKYPIDHGIMMRISCHTETNDFLIPMDAEVFSTLITTCRLRVIADRRMAEFKLGREIV